MRPPLRIAVLECDTPLPNIDARYGGYAGVFTSLLKESAKALDGPDKLDPESDLVISKWDIVNGEEYPKLEDIDAVLLTGSKHNSFEDIPWILRLVEFTQQVLAQDRVRILGICFGHQIIGRAMGAKVGRSDQGWEIAVCDMDLTDKGKELFGRDKIRIQQMHQDIVSTCPQGVTLLGHSPRCAIQGMYLPRRFISVQGHPEFTGWMETEIIQTRAKAGIFKEEMAQDGLSRTDNEHDGVSIGTTFLKFLLEE
ncbi:Glutamine amidotransferase type 1 [Penicillium argentinense]|uniref:Glutamine amidotransferase type 1 n=1 Tax=Penicillium argentinense TaxID=1131581 RepID=A0A9W9FDR0_9EURO|nr:Glutamine amidotransferase type 1 [Penicillium argentinense]KAJ5098307.1 Glutamine amidotransferase type 1 [Penicillium argentinense]